LPAEFFSVLVNLLRRCKKKEDRQELFQKEERTVLDEDERPQRRSFLLTVNMFRNGLTGSGKSVAVSTEQGGEKSLRCAPDLMGTKTHMALGALHSSESNDIPPISASP